MNKQPLSTMMVCVLTSSIALAGIASVTAQGQDNRPVVAQMAEGERQRLSGIEVFTVVVDAGADADIVTKETEGFLKEFELRLAEVGEQPSTPVIVSHTAMVDVLVKMVSNGTTGGAVFVQVHLRRFATMPGSSGLLTVSVWNSSGKLALFGGSASLRRVRGELLRDQLTELRGALPIK